MLSTIVIRPQGRLDRYWLQELWNDRELLGFLIWRDLKVRYKQTAFGAAWAVLQPLLLMAVFSIFFGRLVRVPSDGVPYPVFAYVALVPWTFFAQSLAAASNSLVDNRNLVEKVYVPRLLLPLAAGLSFLVDLFLATLLLIVLMLVYGVAPTPRALWLVAFVPLAVAAALATGTFFSAVNVRYRDVKYAVPFLIQLWMFLSPVVYPVSLVPARWREIYALNPMVGVIDGFRWALLRHGSPPFGIIAVSSAVTLVAFVAAAIYFFRVQRSFADVI